MFQLLENIFSPKQYMPHGSCYLWQTSLISLHVISNALIALAYFSIPAMLIYFVCQRRDIPFNRVFLLFSLFIVSCGFGHLIDIWTLWHPAYWLSGVENAFTALVSCYTALELMVLLPQFLSLKTPEELQVVEAASRSKSLFLAHMSHELRTPMNAILGFTELMYRDVSLSVKHRQYIDIINRSGEHLLALINDILEMSKIEAGQAKLRENTFNLYSQINSIEEMLYLKAQSKGLKLEVQRDPQVPQQICTDESKLRQVLINLLNNAIKFTKKGSVSLRVRSQVLKQLDSQPITYLLTFEVEDTGPGIVPEEQDKLFEAFSQTETGIQSGQGTGLGLPISQKFVQLMGGEITVRSQLGQGTLFTFSIPVTTIKTTPVEIFDTSQIVTKLAEGQPQFRILVADDDPQNCFLLTQLLSSVGFEVQPATNGQEAIEIWSQWKPDLIFMDMQMPVMDGYTATQKIKAFPQEQDTIIIALTAHAFEEERQYILSIGCDDFIRKPFKQQEIFTAMNQHLQVQYCYQDSLTTVNDVQNQRLTQDSGLMLDENALKVMPREWIERLSESAMQCSDLLIIQLIEEIPEQHSKLTQTLMKIVDEFRYDQIFELTQLILNQPRAIN